MKLDIHLEDLKDEVIERIKEVLRYDLADEIDEAARLSMIDRRAAESEVIDNYLNTHNFSQTIEL